MTFNQTQVSAAELAAKARDVPLFIGNNVLEQYNALPQWRVSGSWASGTDISDYASAATWWAHDRQAHLQTFPDQTSLAAAATANVSFICNLNAGSTDLYTFDSVYVFGHNFNLISNMTILLEISNSSSFGSPTILAQWSTPSTRMRLAELVLNLGNYRYDTVQYLRLRFALSVGTFSVSPAFSEMWCGRRRQMPNFPMLPYDEAGTDSEVVDFVADDGSTTRYARSSGRRVIDTSWNPNTTTAAGLDGVAALRNWWSDCAYGSKPSIFVESPNDDSDGSAMIMYPDPKMVMPLKGPTDREVQIGLIETSPYVSGES